MTVLYVALGAAAGRAAPVPPSATSSTAGCRGAPCSSTSSASFVLGLVSGLGLDAEAVALFGVGFCGALTTYSAFAVQTHDRGSAAGWRSCC